MKKFLFAVIGKFGYRIINKKKEREKLTQPLLKYNIDVNFDILFDSKYYLGNLEHKYSDLSIVNDKEGFLVSFLGLNFYVESNEEFHILNEIFVRNDYDFVTASPSIVIDIGANIGVTSLFFSRMPFVESIYSFEPVKDTFDQALYNLDLNSNLHKVKILKNIGLGKNSRKEIFLFDKLWKGNAGVRGQASPSYLGNENALKREVQIESATIEIGQIIAGNSNKKIIVKIDCEGAEYEILQDLYESGMIRNLDVILLEWHDKGSEIIEEILIKSGFDFFKRNFDAITGMIYAIRK